MIARKMKKIISYAIEQDIDYIEVFRGFHGDSVLKLTMSTPEVRDKISRYLKRKCLAHKKDYDISQRYGGSYSIFVGVDNDNDVIKLKGD